MVTTSHRIPSARLLIALAAMVALLAPGLAAAAPSLPVSPAANAVVSARPTFTWTASNNVLTTGYNVYVAAPSQAVPTLAASTLDPAATSATAMVNLPEGVVLTWWIARLDSGLPAEVTPDADRTTIRVAPPAPTLVATPPGLSNNTAPAFSWTGTRTSSRWTILNAAGTPVQGGQVPTASGQATALLASGTFQLQVVQRNAVGAESAPASATFAIDATPPAPLAIAASRPSPSVGVTPSFSWSGVEPGALCWWRVIGAGGTVLQGPASTGGTSAAPAALPAGSYSFEARQVDAVGNAGPWATEPFAILATPGAPPAGSSLAALPSSNWRKLTPRKGATIRSTRPTLRWAAGPTGTRLYNVQIFVVGKNNALKKVRSAFPRARSFTLPRRGALKKGSCYVWRVWPYRGSSFTSTPLGVSHFCIRK